MSKIEIKNIGVNGNDLFNDSESFMNDLSEDTSNNVNGGMITLPPPTTRVTSPIYPEPVPHHPGFPPCPPTRPPFPFPLA